MRRLATAAFAYACALLLAHYVLPDGALPWCAAGLCCLSAFSFFLRGDRRLRALLLALSAAAGFAWYWGYQALFIAPADALAGKTAAVSARVTDYADNRDGYSVLYVRLTEDGYPHVRAAFYDYDRSLPEFAPGDRISAEVTFASATVKYGAETDAYTSRGVFLNAYLKSDPVTEGRSPLSFFYFPKTMARAVKHAADAVFPPDTAAYMKALLTGDKTDLYADDGLYNALGVAGILHVVAVSGMHLSFLYGLVKLLVRARRRAAAVGIPLLWVFALMTGCVPGVVRAAFMLSLLLVAPFIRREADGLTSLAAVLLLLLLANPFSAGSASLQLSFAAMAGIIVISPKLYARLMGDGKSKRRKTDRLRRFFAATVSSTAGAVVFTTPISALRFGYVSLVSPLTNFLVLWAVSVCFIGGYVTVAAGLVWAPLGTAAGWLTAWPARYILAVSKALAGLPFAAVYMVDNLVAWWLAFTYVVFIFAYLRRGGKPFRPAISVSVSVIALSLALVFTALFNNSGASATAMDVGQGQSVAVFDGQDTVVVDCGGINTWQNAGDTVSSYLLSRGRTRVDVLALTHFHEDHVNGVTRLLTRMHVRYLAVPADVDDESGIRPAILEAAEKNGTEIIYVTEDTEVTVGGIRLRLYAPVEAGDENERGMIVLASVADWDMLVTGDVDTAVENRLVETGTLPDCELYIAGHHGSRYSSGYELLGAIRAETAIVSVGYNTYGHPTEDALWRLSAYGMAVYRTDEDGNVTIRIGEDG